MFDSVDKMLVDIVEVCIERKGWTYNEPRRSVCDGGGRPFPDRFIVKFLSFVEGYALPLVVSHRC
jgi:hypothetical protein